MKNKNDTRVGMYYADKSPWESVDDLILQHLLRDEIFNVWCDQLADHAWQYDSHAIPDPPPHQSP
jgi:hypothetical protein